MPGIGRIFERHLFAIQQKLAVIVCINSRQDIHKGWLPSTVFADNSIYLSDTNFEIDLRYDTYTRGENHPTSAANDESTANTITYGAQYHFNKKTRVNVEYADRDYESDTVAVETQQKDVGGRFAIQLTHIF